MNLLMCRSSDERPMTSEALLSVAVEGVREAGMRMLYLIMQRVRGENKSRRNTMVLLLSLIKRINSLISLIIFTELQLSGSWLLLLPRYLF